MANRKILIVEDDYAVAKDIEEKLETLGYTVLPTVSAGVQAIAKVAEMRPDLILIDTGLEGEMDGIEVAREIYNRFEIPVIYLTDYVNEDLLKKVRTTRAFGHVFKPYGIEQLQLSIENHLYWYEEDQKFREGEQWFSTVLSNVGDGVIATDKDGFVAFMNPAAESMTGWQLEETAKVDIKQIFCTDAEENCPVTTVLTHIRHTGPAPASASSTASEANHHAILTAKSGRKTHIDYNVVPSNYAKREPTGIVITFRDSTEYKAIEAELNQTVDKLQGQTELMETVFDSICDGVIAIDTDGQYLMVNSKAQETTGGAFPTYAPIAERPKRYGLFHPDGKTLFSGDELPLTRAMRGETTDNIEMFVCNDDQLEGAFIDVSGRPLRDKQGTLKGGVVVFHDTTELKVVQAELEQTIDELCTQTQLMETVFANMADGIIVTDTDGNLLLSNESATKVFNLETVTPDLVPSTWASRGGLFETDKETYLSTDRNPLLRALQGETTDDMEVFVRNRLSPDGIYLNVDGRPLLNTDNEVTAGVVLFRDTTKDKEAADQLEQTISELRSQTQLMETVFNGISDGIAVVDSMGELLLSNPSMRRTFNMDGVEASPSEWSETYGIFYPDKETHVPVDQLPIFRAMRGEEISEKEFFIQNQNKAFGSYISASATPLRSVDNQEIIGSVGIVRDITQYKEAEIELKQALQEQQEQTQLMETVFNTISDGVVAADTEGRYLMSNTKSQETLGPILDSVSLPDRPKYYGLFHSDGQTLLSGDELPLTCALRGEATDNIEILVSNDRRDDEIFINVSGRPLFDVKGTLKGGVIVFHDITEIKEARATLEQTVNELRSQTQLMETVVNSMNEGLIVSNPEGQVLFTNPSVEQMFGVLESPDLPISEWSKKCGIFYPDQKTHVPIDRIMKSLESILGDRQLIEEEFFIRNQQHPDGVNILSSVIPLRDENQRVTGWVNVIRDITKDKVAAAELAQMMAKLQEQAQLMETVFNNMSEGVVVADSEGKYFMFNETAKQMTGRNLQPTEMQNIVEQVGFFLPDQKTPFPNDQLPIARVLRGEVVNNVEMFMHNPVTMQDGIHLSVSARPLRDAQGVLTGGVSVSRDVTALKQAEKSLKQAIDQLQDQTELLESVFNSISDGVVVTDEAGEFLFVNPSAERIAGIGATDAPLDQWSETYGTFYPDKVTPFPNEDLPLVHAMQGKMTDNVDLFICNSENPEGAFINVTGRPLRNEQNSVRGGVIAFRDVTQIKETEARLEQTVRELQDQTQLMDIIFNSISDGVLVCDENGRYIMLNPTVEQMIGQSLSDPEVSHAPNRYGLFQSDTDSLFPVEELPLTLALKGEATDNVEMRINNPELSEDVYVSVSGRPLLDANGVSRGGVAVARDITELKRTENQLRESITQLESQSQLMQSIFDSISDGVVVADKNGQFTMFNPSAEKIVGMGAVDAGPDEWSDQYGLFFHDKVTLFPPEDLPLTLALQGQATDNVEIFVRNPSVPEGVYVSVNSRPLQSEDGISGGVAVFRDVTERVLNDEALAQAFAQGRLEIVDTILHNIGNAINSVSAGVDTLYEHVASDRLIQRFNALARAVKSHQADWGDYIQNDPQGQKVLPFMLALAEDFSTQNEQLVGTIERVRTRTLHIVDIVRTQKSFDNVRVTAKDIDLQQALLDALKLQQDSIDKRGIHVDIDCANAPAEIRIQESQFNQMLVNLIKNSIEAIDQLAQSGGLSEAPRIEIRAYVDDTFFNLDITDNGIGISEKDTKVIFTAGYTTKETGSGLGLHSIANFVAGSGGQIVPLSEGQGKGTTMRVRLRLASIDPSD